MVAIRGGAGIASGDEVRSRPAPPVGSRTGSVGATLEQEGAGRPAHQLLLGVADPGLGVGDLAGHADHLAAQSVGLAGSGGAHGLHLHLERGPGSVAAGQGGN